MVVKNVAAESDFNGVGCTVALELSARKVGVAGSEAVVDEGVERDRHCVVIRGVVDLHAKKQL